METTTRTIADLQERYRAWKREGLALSEAMDQMTDDWDGDAYVVIADYPEGLPSFDDLTFGLLGTTPVLHHESREATR